MKSECIEKLTAVNKPYFGYRCKGSTHERLAKSCQDAMLLQERIICGKRVMIMAVADGHGSEQYDLSEYGAKLAVENMTELLKQIYRQVNSRSKLFSRLKTDFPAGIQKMWRDSIAADFASRFPREKMTGRDIKRYGTTALFVLAVPEGIFMGQIGDGDIQLVDAYGCQQPLPQHDELVGGQTYSMVSREARRFWNIGTVSIAQKTLLLLSTDGLSNSYLNDAEFNKFLRSLYDNLLEIPPDKLDLARYLTTVSEKGSGDDITLVGLIVRPEEFVY